MNLAEGPLPWFKKCPQLYKKQCDILEAAGFSLEKEPLEQEERIEFTGSLKCDPARRLLVRFPNSFPSAAPKVFDTPASKLLIRHHRMDSRQLCLFGFKECRWSATLSVDAALAEAALLITQFPPGTTITTEEVPEPITRSLTYAQPAVVLVPPPIADFAGFDKLNAAHGTFRITFLNEGDLKKEIRGRGIISAAAFGNENLAWIAPFSSYFPKHTDDYLGEWFFLKQSPTHENIGEVVNKCISQAKTFKKDRPYWLALIFHEEMGNSKQTRLTWLIVRANLAGRSYPIRTYQYIRSERFVRNPRLTKLRDCRVTIIGCGSLGSKIATNLAATGVSKLRLVDCEPCEPMNSVRHEVGVDFFGCPKAPALRNRLCSINPEVFQDSTVTMLQVGAMCPFNQERELYKVLKDSDLVVDATAVHSVSHYLNELSFDFGLPLIAASVTGGAWGGEIVRSIPGKTPCWLCWLEQYYEAKASSAPPGEGEVFAPGCDQPTFVGATHEVGMVANLATSLIIDTLIGPTDVAKNYIRWNGRDSRGIPIYSTELLPISKRENCYLCGSQYAV